jgi:5-formyltetrahydrofolate cyclo-ligase
MTDVPEVGAAKSALRAHHLARRHARSRAERDTAAAAVSAALLRGLAGIRALAAYVPAPEEPGHGRLPAAFAELRAQVLLPVVPAEGAELCWAVDTGRLAPGRYGLSEPVGPRLPPAAVGTVDVVVAPALAVSRDGVRLGRGGGYYDRALRHVRPGAVLVAVVFDDELLDDLPVEPHDRQVTAVVTPSGGWQAISAGH